MNNLIISADVTKDMGLQAFPIMRQFFDSPILAVEVRFQYSKNDARSSRSIIVKMQARLRGQDEEAIRCELLQSVETWQECDIYADDKPGDGGDEWTIKTIDPDGVLKWLGIDFETFKKYQQNAEPLRLPSPGVK